MAKTEKLNISIIKDRLISINPKIEILSEIYIRSNEYLRCKCLECNHEWDITWNNLQRGRNCPKCSRAKRAEYARLDISDIKNKLKLINGKIEILDSTYKNNRSKLNCKCLICNNVWGASWSNLRAGKGCPNCAIRKVADLKRYDIDYIRESLLEMYGGNVILLSDTYNNAFVKIECKCKVCNSIWSTTWDVLRSGHSCPKCGIKKRSGENFYNWKGGISELSSYLRNFIERWRIDSLNKNKCLCDITKQKGYIIHHLIGFNTIVKETLETLDIPIYREICDYSREQLKDITDTCLELHYKYGLGVCLTEEEHKRFHSIYGYGDNTPEQYYEYKNMRLKELNNNHSEIA